MPRESVPLRAKLGFGTSSAPCFNPLKQHPEDKHFQACQRKARQIIRDDTKMESKTGGKDSPPWRFDSSVSDENLHEDEA